jgi:hypothetical protein
MNRALLLLLAIASAATGAAAHQATRGGVDQIGATQPVGMQQISGRAAPAAPPQLSSASESNSPAQQLTNERGAGAPAQQLSRGPRSAQESQPLSQPRDGRTAAVERVAGSDRCDPRAKGPRLTACAAVIETRAAQFTRPDTTPLSPEQRIIAEQQQRERGGSVGGAARRLAANGEDVDSPEAQGVASIVLARPPAPPQPVKPLDDPSVSEPMRALVNAIVNQSQTR